jgi:hypothetical protein
MAAQLFDAVALTLFLKEANNMGLSHRTRLQLAVEGITEPKDFKKFEYNGMTAIFTNLLKPPKVPALGAAAHAAGTLQEIQAYEVSAKSKMSLKGATLFAQFYDNVGRPLDPDNMSWLVIKQFLEQWKALMERKKANHGQPPKLTKNQAVHKWVDSFNLHLSQKVGVRNAPLDYIVRATAAVDPIPPACQVGYPHSIETGSIDRDLMARMPHNLPLFKVDNGLTFDMIKMSLCGHDVAATIAPLHCRQDGRGALLALQSQHAGKVIYDQLVKDAENILKKKGRSWGLLWLLYLSTWDCIAKHTSLSLSVLSIFLWRSQMIGHKSPISLILSRQLIHLSLLLWLQYVRMMLTSVSTSRMHSLSWHPPALSLRKPQRRGGFLLRRMSLVLGVNLTRVVWVEIMRNLGRERLGSPLVTTSSKTIGTCPRNSKKS